MNESVLRVDGVDINCAEGGNPRGTPMLMLHGIASWWQTFEPLIAAFAPDYRIVAPDLRGSGRSGRQAGSYLLTRFVDDNLAVLRAKFDRPAVLVGHSFGGLMSLAIAAREPQRVRAAVLIDAPLFFRRARLTDTAWPRFFTRVLQLINASEDVDTLAALLAPRLAHATPAEVRARAAHLLRLDPDPIRMHMTDRNMDGFDLNQLVPQVGCPLLLIHADPALGAASDDADIDWIEQVIPRIRVHRMKHVGHMVHETHSGDVIAHMRDFIATPVSPSLE